MQEITHEAYLEALEIVRNYHRQILAVDAEINKDQKEVKMRLETDTSYVPLTDFIAKYNVPRRVYTSVIGNFLEHRGNWTVEEFLSSYLEQVHKFQTLGCLAGVSAKTMTEFLITAGENGFAEQVKPFEAYFEKKSKT